MDGKTAIELAFEQRKFDEVLKLLKSDHRFPSNFTYEVASDELKQFADLCDNLHASIKNENLREIGRILSENPNLIYFYNSSTVERNQSEKVDQTQKVFKLNRRLSHYILLLYFLIFSLVPRKFNLRLNKIFNPFSSRFKKLHFYRTNNAQNKSALRTALEHRKFEIYENLHKRGLSFAPDENFDEIIADFSEQEKTIIRKNHNKASTIALSKPRAVLNMNSRFGPNCPNKQEHKNFVNEAYDYLFCEAGLQSVLNTVIASRDFTIYYDFSRKCTTFIDPNSDRSTNGSVYLSGEIYIAALNMLNQELKFEVFGVIAHELTHYAMFLTYNNFSKPYFEKDQEKIVEFSRIVEECQNSEVDEELIDNVFMAYHRESWPAELIVRVPQMMAQYHNQPEILAQRRETFFWLFKFYEQTCVPDMEKALPTIKKKFRSEKEKKSARRKRNLWIVSLMFGLFLVLGLPFGTWFWLKSFSWENLSFDQKTTVRKTSINYLDCEVSFSEIIPENSLIYTTFTSSQILGALWGSPFEFPKTVDEEMEKYVYLNSSNLPECLQDKLLTSNVNFQGQNLTMSELLTNKSRAFELFKSPQIVQILKGKENFNISHQLEQKAKFYVEREFAKEKCLNLLEAKKHWFYFCMGIGCNKCRLSNLSTILEESQTSRLFFLSSPAGQGKSTTFRYIALKLKEKWPQKWVEFVDLKNYLKAFEIGNKTEFNTSEVLEKFLAKTLLNLTNFESAVFAEKFQNGDVIFLWDGIDEISPFLKDFMLVLTSKYKNLTENWQFASTRPQFSEEFKKKLNISAFGLAPLDEEKKYEFLVKFSFLDQIELVVDDFYESIRPCLNFSLSIGQILTELRSSNAFRDINKSESNKTIKIIKNGDQIPKSIKNSHENLSPILIEMAVEAAKNENFTISQDFNTFLLYESFVDEKFKIALEKGDVVVKDLNRWTHTDTLSYKQAHQTFALKTLYYFDSLSDSVKQYLNKKIEKVLQKKSKVEISRFGILNINSEDDLNFVHRTFAEFFSTKFFINNLIEDFTPNNETEIENLLYTFNEVFNDEKFQVVRKFITDFLDLNQNKDLDFAKYLRKHNLRLETLKKITEDEKNGQLVQVVDISYYFFKKYKISKQLILVPYFFHVVYLDFSLSNWEKLVQIFGEEKMRFALEIRNNHGYNLLFDFLSIKKVNETALLPKMLKLYEENFNQTQLKELLIDRKYNNNVLMLAAQRQNLKYVEILWNFMKKNLKSEEIREILKMEEDDYKKSVLESSKWNENVEVFLFMKKIYNETLTREEIKKIILTFEEEKFPFSFISIYNKNSEVCIDISKFLFELFEDDILTLKSSFKRHAEKENEWFKISNGETILSYIKIKKKDEKCFEFYKKNGEHFTKMKKVLRLNLREC